MDLISFSVKNYRSITTTTDIYKVYERTKELRDYYVKRFKKTFNLDPWK